MTLSIINSPGLTTSNAYTSLATAEIYISENIHISDTWASLSTQNRINSIIYATSLLDAEIDWIGDRATETQALRWPRTSVYDTDGYAVDDSIIPTFLQKATSFFAYFLSQNNRTSENSTRGFKSLKAGSLAMTIDKYDRIEVMPDIIYDLIKGYGNRIVGRSRVLERI